MKWPTVAKPARNPTQSLAHVIDVMATFVEVAGAQHPRQFKGLDILPLEGQSLLPILKGDQNRSDLPIFWEHEGNRAVRTERWKLVSRHPGPWELYDVEADRTGQHDLAAQHPELVKELAARYTAWAARCQVLPLEKLPGSLPIKSGE